jgi:hypothetical protein
MSTTFRFGPIHIATVTMNITVDVRHRRGATRCVSTGATIAGHAYS